MCTDTGEDQAKVERRAREVLGPGAYDWLTTPNRALGRKPTELMGTEEGARQVLGVLGRIQEGVYS